MSFYGFADASPNTENLAPMCLGVSRSSITISMEGQRLEARKKQQLMLDYMKFSNSQDGSLYVSLRAQESAARSPCLSLKRHRTRCIHSFRSLQLFSFNNISKLLRKTKTDSRAIHVCCALPACRA